MILALETRLTQDAGLSAQYIHQSTQRLVAVTYMQTDCIFILQSSAAFRPVINYLEQHLITSVIFHVFK